MPTLPAEVIEAMGQASRDAVIARDPRLGRLNPPLSKTPCGSCTLCCYGTQIVLKPEYGDDVEGLETERLVGGQLVLKHRADGACVYLTPKGCGIWDRRPLLCREFDCRGVWLARKKLDVAKMVHNDLIDKRVLHRGRDLVARSRGWA